MYTEDDWTDIDTAMPYEKSKTLAEKAAWDFVQGFANSNFKITDRLLASFLSKERQKNNLPCFEMAVINPGVILGPSLHNVEYTSMEIIKKLMERQTPVLPKIQFPTCDVRDCALAHIRAMIEPDAVNNSKQIFLFSNPFQTSKSSSILTQGHIITNSVDSPTMQDYAAILHAEFRSQGYSVPTWVVPDILIRFASIFDSTIRLVTPFLGYKFKFDNSRMKNVLKIDQPIELKKTVLDMAYDMINKGHIKKY
jgi:nucleoside-diphosphate-sugar epimerase